MASVLKSLLGYRPDTTSEKRTKRGLPASWYRSPELYELERRAIFSQKWMLITHKSRFDKAGDYLRFTEAGFNFFLCLDRQGNIGGFHNVCRHRGFPLLHDDSGNAKILACKYHGWSYGVNGKLAKAPHFEQFPDFEKDHNGLLPVHVHVDRLGFIWVNLDASEPPATLWNDQFERVDMQQRYESFNFDDYRYDHTWGMPGEYNWKTLADNYNECLHCRTAHPDTSGVVDVTVYRVEPDKGQVLHFNQRQETGANEGKIQIASTFFFPNACMTVSPHFFYLMRCVPTSASTCSMEYEVYRHKDAADEDFNNIDQIFKRILAEDKLLCNATQKNVQSGVFVNGQMHPEFEKGPLYFQELCKTAVLEHHAREQKQKKQIWPAAQSVTGSSDTDDAMAFCSGLTCAPGDPTRDW